MEISEEFYDHVEKVAKSASYKWEDLDWEDIRQDIWVWLMENIPQLEQYQEDTYDDRDKKLRRVATQVCVAEIHGYEQYSGQYLYGRDEVRGMLEQGVPFKSEHMGTATERADLTLALTELKEHNLAQFTVITDRYFKGEYDSTPAKRKMMERGLDNLTQLMNRIHNFNEYTYQDGIGARKVLSNSTSLAITGSWE